MNDILEKIGRIQIVPVIAMEDASRAPALARALLAGGIACAEVTFRTQAGEAAIREISTEVPEILVGAGTILNVEQARRAMAAGAKFIVSPGLNPAVVAFCVEQGVPIIPGCATPSEMEQAMAFGLTTLKFFPAEQAGGLRYLQAVSAPYPQLRFLPTGGIGPNNLAEYLEFPKIVACGGSWMAPRAMIDAGEFDKITQLCQEAIRARTKPKPSAPQTIGPPQKVVTFGEIMLRLTPENHLRFVQADKFLSTVGGAEANVAVDLCNLGACATFVTKLPAHEIGQFVVNTLRQYGVDTSHIVRGGQRVGIYYCEKGASQRPSKVVYDRAGSAIAEARPGEFDWDAILRGAGWFHFTGITPALSEGCAALCLKACQAARRQGIPVSCDLNYRKNLWSRARAGQVMAQLMPFVSLLIANEEDAANVFDIHAAGSDIQQGKLLRAGYVDVARQLHERFGIPKISITLRQSVTANDNIWAAMLYEDGVCRFSKEYAVHIVDRVGGGDAFGAGLIYGALTGLQGQEQLEFAVAASCLKHAVEGDFNHVSVEEVRRLAAGDATGRVQR
jgi:2-dehydro-3-deoxygluconokinase